MESNQTKVYDVAVIGGGGAGQMAALRAVLNHLDTVMFLGDANTNRKGRAQWVAAVENMPGFFDQKRPITSSTKDTLKFIESREDLNPFLTVEKKVVTTLVKTDQGFELKAGENTYTAKYVVLCTGTMDVQPEINGSIKPILPFANRGDVEYCIRCDGHKSFGKKTAIIGHTNGAAWVAIILKERYKLKNLTILTHGKDPEFEPEIQKTIDHYGIDVMTANITGIIGSPKEGLEGFELGDHSVDVQKAYVALGSIVYNDLAKQVGADLDAREHLVTNEKCETSVAGFYAAGDLVSQRKKQVYTAWDMAVDAVDDIDQKIRKARREQALKAS